MFLALLLACGETPAPVAPPAAAPRPTFACCDTPEASAVLQAYVGVNAALAADKSAAEPMAALAAATQKELPEVSQALGPLASMDIAGQRQGLNPQSAAIVSYLRAHKGGAETVSEAFCPMANAGWVQAGDTVANPYYGSEMLTCGYFKE
ncbi:MAG: DUF3347 domain-containing protein [Deltaproteobacteria bacterium]|nr:DUF3347 domain-containing protein [Deltaproteobacteria bacterium]